MPLISDPVGQALVLAGVIAAALAVVLTPGQRRLGRLNETAVLLLSSALLLGAAVLYLWASVPRGLLLAAALFVAAAALARPKGSAQCARFASGFLVVSLALPIAANGAGSWTAMLAVVASLGLALCLLPKRLDQLSAVSAALIWAALQTALQSILTTTA